MPPEGYVPEYHPMCHCAIDPAPPSAADLAAVVAEAEAILRDAS